MTDDTHSLHERRDATRDYRDLTIEDLIAREYQLTQDLTWAASAVSVAVELLHRAHVREQRHRATIRQLIDALRELRGGERRAA
jgi:hypothetical protein